MAAAHVDLRCSVEGGEVFVCRVPISATTLDLNGKSLSALPPEIGSLVNLQTLHLYSNELTTLPPEIGNLKNLRILSLYRNKLVALPKEIGKLKLLTVLSVNGNQLESLPREIGKLKNLKELYISDNKLAKLPHELGRLSSLQELRLLHNPFVKPFLNDLAARRNFYGDPDNVVAAALSFLRSQKHRHRHRHARQAPHPPSKQSSILDVCQWLETIGLGEVVGCFKQNRIDGSVLFDLSETDLPQIGVTAFGHKKKLLSALRDLHQAPSPSVVATPPVVQAPAAPPPSTQRASKFVAPESESVTYKGLLELPASYKPQGTCAQELLAARTVLRSKVPQLGLIVKEVGSVSWSILAGQTAQELVKTHGLTEQEVFAIVAYTYDLGLSGAQSENLYFQLNELLRRRVADEMRAVMGFLYFILGALRKLPAFEGTVFRGNNSPGMVASEYTTGREIFWSGFTSTTTDLAAALDFAGCDGVVFRIKINSGRSIALLSVMQRENEVLLPPNACLIVFSEMHCEADGVQYVDLVEKKDSFRW